MLRWRSSLVALLLLLARVSALAPQPPEGEEEALPDPHSTEEIEEARMAQPLQTSRCWTCQIPMATR